MEKYSCHPCNYSTNRITNLERHKKSEKHNKNVKNSSELNVKSLNHDVISDSSDCSDLSNEKEKKDKKIQKNKSNVSFECELCGRDKLVPSDRTHEKNTACI